MKHDQNKRIAHEILIFMALLALLCFVVRLWPAVFLFVLGIFAAALRLLFLSTKKVEVIEPANPVEPPPKKPLTEQDVLRDAYGVIQMRITDEVAARHPAARWVWETPNAQAAIQEGKPAYILMNGAGGYRKARVVVENLQFHGLDYDCAKERNTLVSEEKAASIPVDSPYKDAAKGEQDFPEPVNYELLAFEWVDEHMGLLNERCHEAIAKKDDHLLIPTTDLPAKESWKDICQQLIRNGFSLAMDTEEGIRVNLPQ